MDKAMYMQILLYSISPKFQYQTYDNEYDETWRIYHMFYYMFYMLYESIESQIQFNLVVNTCKYIKKM